MDVRNFCASYRTRHFECTLIAAHRWSITWFCSQRQAEMPPAIHITTAEARDFRPKSNQQLCVKKRYPVLYFARSLTARASRSILYLLSYSVPH